MEHTIESTSLSSDCFPMRNNMNYYTPSRLCLSDCQKCNNEKMKYCTYLRRVPAPIRRACPWSQPRRLAGKDQHRCRPWCSVVLLSVLPTFEPIRCGRKEIRKSVRIRSLGNVHNVNKVLTFNGKWWRNLNYLKFGIKEKIGRARFVWFHRAENEWRMVVAAVRNWVYITTATAMTIISMEGSGSSRRIELSHWSIRRVCDWINCNRFHPMAWSEGWGNERLVCGSAQNTTDGLCKQSLFSRSPRTRRLRTSKPTRWWWWSSHHHHHHHHHQSSLARMVDSVVWGQCRGGKRWLKMPETR